MSDIDRIFQELSEIRQKLEGLPSDDRAERASLESRREELHAQAGAIQGSVGDLRSSAEIGVELDSLKAQLRQIEGSEVNIVEQYGGSVLEGTGAADGIALNRQIEEGQGAGELRGRIEALEKELAKREAAES